MSCAVTIFLLASLVIVKGGVHAYVFMAWTGIALVLAFYVCFIQKKLNFNSVISDNKLRNNQFYQHPIFVFFCLQLWLALQIFLGITKNIQASIDDLLLGIGFLCFFLIMRSFQWRQSAIKHLLMSLFIIAVIQAIYGLWVFLTQSNVILWMEKVHYLDKPTGTLVNANHFAAYLSLILVLLVSYIFSQFQYKANQQKSRVVIFSILDNLYSIHMIIVVLLLFAIFATRSIGGIGSLLLTALSALLFLFIQKRQKGKSGVAIFLAIIVCLSFFFAVLVDYSIIQKELSILSFTFERRLEISSAALKMVVDNWLLGVGAGGFYSSFSQYRDITVGNSFYHFAHNDYLQFLAEFGLIGFLIALSFVVICLKRNLQVLKHSKNMYRRSFAYASIYGSLMLAIHSLVDFPLQIPAYALLYLTIISFNPLTYQYDKE